MTHSTSFTSGDRQRGTGGILWSAVAMLAGIAVLTGCNAKHEDPKQEPVTPPEVSYLDQGWSGDLRNRYYFDPQGSRLMPYD